MKTHYFLLGLALATATAVAVSDTEQNHDKATVTGVELVGGDWYNSSYDKESPGCHWYYGYHKWNWDEDAGGYVEKGVFESDCPDEGGRSICKYWLLADGTKDWECESYDRTNNVWVAYQPEINELDNHDFKQPWANGALWWSKTFMGGGMTHYYCQRRQAKGVRIMYRPGGKSEPGRKAVFVAGGSAREVISDPELGFRDGPEVAPEEITVEGFGRELGADGKAYAALPAGEPVDITLKAQRPYYNFIVDAQQHIPYVMANEHDLRTETPEFCVGQNVTLTLDWEPDLNVSKQCKWIRQPSCVNQILPPSLPDSAPVYTTDLNLLTNNPCSPNWWYDGGRKMVICTCIVGTGSQASTVKLRGYVDIYRPTVDSFHNQGNRSFTLRSIYLAYGNRFANPPNGMIWDAQIHSKYEGRKGITQIIKIREAGHPIPVKNDTLNSLAADAGEFYSGTEVCRTNKPLSLIYIFEDWPETPLGLLGAEVLIPSARDYLRFKPGLDENDGNIYVTLGIVKWSASGVYDFGVGWSANDTPPADDPDSSYDFPFWVEIIQE